MSLKSNDVSNILGVSVRTIQRWVKSGKLKPETSVNNSYTFAQDEITNFIKKNKLKINSENINSISIEEKLESLSNKIDLLNIRINSKADDVVFAQVINQRNEIEDLKLKNEQLVEEIKCLQTIIEDIYNKKCNTATSRKSGSKSILSNIFIR